MLYFESWSTWGLTDLSEVRIATRTRWLFGHVKFGLDEILDCLSTLVEKITCAHLFA